MRQVSKYASALTLVLLVSTAGLVAWVPATESELSSPKPMPTLKTSGDLGLDQSTAVASAKVLEDWEFTRTRRDRRCRFTRPNGRFN